MSRKRRICVVTGSRAEYGLLKPVMSAIKSHPNLKLLVIVSGMHLSKQFGKTINLVKQDGFEVNYLVEMDPAKNDAAAMAIAIGKGILGMTRGLKKLKPDILLILGDRIETLAAAIAGAYMNIPIAHTHGGDISAAGLDESARHAITKLAHIHFTATRKSKERIIRMGEKPKYVWQVGAPGLDDILKGPILSKQELAKRFKLDFERPLLVLLQHSVTTQIDSASFQIKETLKAIEELGMQTVVIYPNSDAGGRTIIREIETRRGLFTRIFKNIPRNLYLSFLKHSSVLIGNSSGGIIETPLLKLPVVNIGIRQNGRERSTNVIDVPHDKDAIVKAIKKALYDKKFLAQVKRCKNPYGDGHASERIVKVLSTIKLDKKLLQKQITY
ncbi:MAG: UDP-N-acetylglucosamine 2-epimerase [bacterium]